MPCRNGTKSQALFSPECCAPGHGPLRRKPSFADHWSRQWYKSEHPSFAPGPVLFRLETSGLLRSRSLLLGPNALAHEAKPVFVRPPLQERGGEICCGEGGVAIRSVELRPPEAKGCRRTHGCHWRPTQPWSAKNQIYSIYLARPGK